MAGVNGLAFFLPQPMLERVGKSDFEQAGWIERFRRHSDAIEPQPAFDPRARWFFYILAPVLLIEAALVISGKFTFTAGAARTLFANIVLLACAAPLARRYGHPRIATALDALVLPMIKGCVIGTATVMVSSIAGPFADAELNRVDRLMGFDWLARLEFYRQHHWIAALSQRAYGSMIPQLGVVPVLLVLTGRDDRMWRFITAFAIAGVITTAVHPFFPAVGPHAFYRLTLADLPPGYPSWPWQMGRTIEALKLGQIKEITASWTGLVTFPSFHAAAAIMLGWASLALRWGSIPLIALNAVMWLATPICGSHYLIDTLAGTIVAAISIVIANALVAHTDRRAVLSKCS